MKNLIVLIAFLAFVKVNAQDLTIIHINAKWNVSNNYKYMDEIHGAKIQYGYLENQPDNIKQSIKAVPTLILTKKGRTVYVWNADISLKLKVNVKEIQQVINGHRFPQRRKTVLAE
jgi:hypothetical protein